MHNPSEEFPPVKSLVDRIAAATEAVHKMRIDRRMMEYPPGHPEEPIALKKFREANPNYTPDDL